MSRSDGDCLLLSAAVATSCAKLVLSPSKEANKDGTEEEEDDGNCAGDG